jgi:Ca2+-binding RTX toxin-like protein
MAMETSRTALTPALRPVAATIASWALLEMISSLAMTAAAAFLGTGHDWIMGGGGNDTIFGEAGNDIIIGGNGNDEIDGGLGQRRD